eukprot:CAMPEP_0197027006 /NCGR_PEP_ID=MMETSP1384-20130603/6997_1 /TAXON_ID=29189 /ORGANISM="Ammonia sp." /LENGTH=381 /DNA_ID=CAMNT_0042455795 /DNA_START=20 /DNA_END=1165 /DNA_ORIENTATION=+
MACAGGHNLSLTLTVTESTISMEGYLEKYSYYLKKARRRWMVIRDNYLYSYKHKQNYASPTEIFDLHSFYVAMVCTQSHHQLGEFELIGLNETRTFIAPSLSEMQRWVNTINAIITRVDADGYVTKLCSNVLCISQKQRNGMESYAKLSRLGFNNHDLCLLAACKFGQDLDGAVNYILETMNAESIVLREHSLHKKSRWVGQWRKRWTVLMYEPYANICYLTTYKQRKLYKQPTEYLILSRKTDVFIEDEHDAVFTLNLNDEHKTSMQFKAASVKQRDDWVALLRARKNNWSVLHKHHHHKHHHHHHSDDELVKEKGFILPATPNNCSSFMESGEKRSFEATNTYCTTNTCCTKSQSSKPKITDHIIVNTGSNQTIVHLDL